jgi:hypothetical protein
MKNVYPTGKFSLDDKIIIYGRWTIRPLQAIIHEDRRAEVEYLVAKTGQPGIEEKKSNGKVIYSPRNKRYEIVVTVHSFSVHMPMSSEIKLMRKEAD